MRSHPAPYHLALLLLLGVTCGFASRAVAAPTAYNLYWDDCSLGAAHTDETDACDSNIGPPHKMVASLMPGEILGGLVGTGGVIRMIVDAPILPDWWRMDVGGCRSGALTGDGAIGRSNPPFSCATPWTASGAWGVNFSPDPGSLNRANIQWINAEPETVTIDPGISPEWYLMAINMLRIRTTTCSGCDVPACLVLNEVRLFRNPGDPRFDLILKSPALSGHVTFQGGGPIDCPAATPTRGRTWGQLKTLYRE